MRFHYHPFYLVSTEDVYGNASFVGVFLNKENAEEFTQYIKKEWGDPWVYVEEYDMSTDYIEGDING